MRKFVINVNGKSYEVEVDEIKEDGTPAFVPQASTQQSAPALVKKEAATKPANVAAGAVKITSPMPGNIWEIKASPGDSVTKGQVILVLEAMKMENEIVAPQDGKVASIPVAKGASVNAGDILATLE